MKLLLILLLACGGKGGDTGAPSVDADGDGYRDVVDCDDADPEIHPGAVEICDELDNDCDGLTDMDDPDLVGFATWYADTDGDGYGNEDDVAHGCEQPEGTASTGGDCDDRDDDINPEAMEVCDGQDNDCDGLVDDEDDQVYGDPSWYVDADADGYGDPDTAVQACEQPAGTIAQGDDCDDTSADVYPGASETEGDGVDSDCDGAD